MKTKNQWHVRIVGSDGSLIPHWTDYTRKRARAVAKGLNLPKGRVKVVKGGIW